MRIERRYTKDGQSPYADIAFRLTTSEIRNPDGSVVFKAENVEVPEFWSQVASDVLAQKYFRKAGVPARLKKVVEETIPSWRRGILSPRFAAKGLCPRVSRVPLNGARHYVRDASKTLKTGGVRPSTGDKMSAPIWIGV